MVRHRKIILTVILVAATSCQQERHDEPSRDVADGAKHAQDAAYCGTISERPDATFENAKSCYMAACEKGDGEACDLARTYNGNLFPGVETEEIDPAESALINGLEQRKADRPTEPEELLEAYRGAGLINTSPDFEADYNAYYRVRSPGRFLGYPLLAFETETMRAAGWIGCCINEGLSILVRTAGNDTAAEEFAEQLGCRLERGDFSGKAVDFRQLGIEGLEQGQSDMVLISCHENDGSRP